MTKPPSIELCVGIGMILILSADLVTRWRNRDRVQPGSGGLYPYPTLAILGGISSVASGWLGWGLLVTAGLAATDALRNNSPVQIGGWVAGIEIAIFSRLTLMFQAATIAMCIKTCLVLAGHMFGGS